MVLVDNQIERLLRGVPFARGHPCGEFAAAANDVDVINNLSRIGTGKFIGKPRNLVAALHETVQIGVGHAFSAAGERVARVAPVEH